MESSLEHEEVISGEENPLYPQNKTFIFSRSQMSFPKPQMITWGMGGVEAAAPKETGLHTENKV